MIDKILNVLWWGFVQIVLVVVGIWLLAGFLQQENKKPPVEQSTEGQVIPKV